MKKTDTFTKILAYVLLGALVVYMAAWLWRSTHNSVVTAPVTAVTVSDSVQADGIAVRQEELLTSDRTYVSVQAQDGQAVASGSTLALAMDSEAALERMNHIAELKLEISSLETLIAGVTSSADVTARDESVRSAVLELTAATSRGEIADVEGAALDLSSLVFKTDASTDSQTRLAQLKSELAGYSDTSSGASALKADAAGVFSRTADGYEGVTPKELENLTVSGLAALKEKKSPVDANVYGKLITDTKWYFAAVIDETHAKRLAAGQTAYLEFSRYYSDKIAAKVVSISAAENGSCAVVFSTERALSDTLSMRTAAADIVFSETDGLRVPLKAVHVDENGKTYVYCVTARQAEKKFVNVLTTGDDYYLVSVDTDADALREGNTVIVSGKDIYKGKVIES